MAFSAESPTGLLRVGIVGAALIAGLLAGVDPKLAVVMALGLGFVVLVLADLAIGVALFTLISFLDVVPVGGAAVSFAKVAGLLLALSWLAAISTRDENAANFLTAHPVFSYLLVIFVGWAGLSLLWAEAGGDTIDAVYRLALNVLLFMIVFTAVRERRHAMWVLGAFMAGALLSAAYGVMSPAPTGADADVGRLGGAGVDPNELAALLVSALTISAAFAAGPRVSPSTRLVALVTVPLCFVGILFSFSRGGLIALAVALIAAVVVGGRWRPAAALLLVTLGLSAFGYIALVATPEERDRVTQLDGGTGRTDIWTVGWRMVEANPVRGVGAGNFDVASIHYLLEPGALKRDDFIVDTPKVAHNMYLEVQAELGLVGFIPFMAIIVFSLASSLAAARAFAREGDERMELLSRATFVALLALLAADFFLSEEYSKQLWVLLALGPSLRAVAAAATSPEPEEPHTRAPSSEPAPAAA